MKRTSERRPGYDCRLECKHEPKGEHGINGGEWRYTVAEGGHGVSLIVLAGDYPESVERPLPSGLDSLLLASLDYHTAQADGNDCHLVDGGKCSLDTHYRRGCRFWREHGDRTQFEQPESFWLALEAEQRKLAAGEAEPGLSTMIDIIMNYAGATS